MSDLYQLLENILNDFEAGLKEPITGETLAAKHDLSSGHLRRLFRFAFNFKQQFWNIKIAIPE